MTIWERQLLFKKWFLETLMKSQELELSFQEIHQVERIELYGEYLMKAQGEDIVAGIRTPQDISKLKDISAELYTELYDIAKIRKT